MDVSIIMPAYNAAEYIDQAIEGILSQQFNGSYELLIADDCSKDDTRRVISSYQNRYPQIVKAIYNKSNLGCSDNSIQLALNAQGTYIAFCDSDDVWIDCLKMQKQFEFLESNLDCGIVCSDANVITGAQKPMFAPPLAK